MATYTVRRLCWFGMRLWQAIQERKAEKAKEAAKRQGRRGVGSHQPRTSRRDEA